MTSSNSSKTNANTSGAGSWGAAGTSFGIGGGGGAGGSGNSGGPSSSPTRGGGATTARQKQSNSDYASSSTNHHNHNQNHQYTSSGSTSSGGGSHNYTTTNQPNHNNRSPGGYNHAGGKTNRKQHQQNHHSGPSSGGGGYGEESSRNNNANYDNHTHGAGAGSDRKSGGHRSTASLGAPNHHHPNQNGSPHYSSSATNPSSSSRAHHNNNNPYAYSNNSHNSPGAPPRMAKAAAAAAAAKANQENSGRKRSLKKDGGGGRSKDAASCLANQQQDFGGDNHHHLRVAGDGGFFTDVVGDASGAAGGVSGSRGLEMVSGEGILSHLDQHLGYIFSSAYDSVYFHQRDLDTRLQHHQTKGGRRGGGAAAAGGSQRSEWITEQLQHGHKQLSDIFNLGDRVHFRAEKQPLRNGCAWKATWVSLLEHWREDAAKSSSGDPAIKSGGQGRKESSSMQQLQQLQKIAAGALVNGGIEQRDERDQGNESSTCGNGNHQHSATTNGGNHFICAEMGTTETEGYLSPARSLSGTYWASTSGGGDDGNRIDPGGHPTEVTSGEGVITNTFKEGYGFVWSETLGRIYFTQDSYCKKFPRPLCLFGPEGQAPALKQPVTFEAVPQKDHSPSCCWRAVAIRPAPAGSVRVPSVRSALARVTHLQRTVGSLETLEHGLKVFFTLSDFHVRAGALTEVMAQDDLVELAFVPQEEKNEFMYRAVHVAPKTNPTGDDLVKFHRLLAAAHAGGGKSKHHSGGGNKGKDGHHGSGNSSSSRRKSTSGTCTNGSHAHAGHSSSSSRKSLTNQAAVATTTAPTIPGGAGTVMNNGESPVTAAAAIMHHSSSHAGPALIAAAASGAERVRTVSLGIASDDKSYSQAVKNGTPAKPADHGIAGGSSLGNGNGCGGGVGGKENRPTRRTSAGGGGPVLDAARGINSLSDLHRHFRPWVPPPLVAAGSRRSEGCINFGGTAMGVGASFGGSRGSLGGDAAGALGAGAGERKMSATSPPHVQVISQQHLLLRKMSSPLDIMPDISGGFTMNTGPLGAILPEGLSVTPIQNGLGLLPPPADSRLGGAPEQLEDGKDLTATGSPADYVVAGMPDATTNDDQERLIEDVAVELSDSAAASFVDSLTASSEKSDDEQPPWGGPLEPGRPDATSTRLGGSTREYVAPFSARSWAPAEDPILGMRPKSGSVPPMMMRPGSSSCASNGIVAAGASVAPPAPALVDFANLSSLAVSVSNQEREMMDQNQHILLDSNYKPPLTTTVLVSNPENGAGLFVPKVGPGEPLMIDTGGATAPLPAGSKYVVNTPGGTGGGFLGPASAPVPGVLSEFMVQNGATGMIPNVGGNDRFSGYALVKQPSPPPLVPNPFSATVQPSMLSTGPGGPGMGLRGLPASGLLGEGHGGAISTDVSSPPPPALLGPMVESPPPPTSVGGVGLASAGNGIVRNGAVQACVNTVGMTSSITNVPASTGTASASSSTATTAYVSYPPPPGTAGGPASASQQPQLTASCSHGATRPSPSPVLSGAGDSSAGATGLAGTIPATSTLPAGGSVLHPGAPVFHPGTPIFIPGGAAPLPHPQALPGGYVLGFAPAPGPAGGIPVSPLASPGGPTAAAAHAHMAALHQKHAAAAMFVATGGHPAAHHGAMILHPATMGMGMGGHHPAAISMAPAMKLSPVGGHYPAAFARLIPAGCGQLSPPVYQQHPPTSSNSGVKTSASASRRGGGSTTPTASSGTTGAKGGGGGGRFSPGQVSNASSSSTTSLQPGGVLGSKVSSQNRSGGGGGGAGGSSTRSSSQNSAKVMARMVAGNSRRAAVQNDGVSSSNSASSSPDPVVGTGAGTGTGTGTREGGTGALLVFVENKASQTDPMFFKCGKCAANCCLRS